MLIFFLSKNNMRWVLRVYDPPKSRGRKAFWEELAIWMAFAAAIFASVLLGILMLTSSMRLLVDFVESTSCFDLPLVSMRWLLGSRVTSDHRWLFLIQGLKRWDPCPFGFENMWLDHPNPSLNSFFLVWLNVDISFHKEIEGS